MTVSSLLLCFSTSFQPKHSREGPPKEVFSGRPSTQPSAESPLSVEPPVNEKRSAKKPRLFRKYSRSTTDGTGTWTRENNPVFLQTEAEDQVDPNTSPPGSRGSPIDVDKPIKEKEHPNVMHSIPRDRTPVSYSVLGDKIVEIVNQTIGVIHYQNTTEQDLENNYEEPHNTEDVRHQLFSNIMLYMKTITMPKLMLALEKMDGARSKKKEECFEPSTCDEFLQLGSGFFLCGLQFLRMSSRKRMGNTEEFAEEILKKYFVTNPAPECCWSCGHQDCVLASERCNFIDDYQKFVHTTVQPGDV